MSIEIRGGNVMREKTVYLCAGEIFNDDDCNRQLQCPDGGPCLSECAFCDIDLENGKIYLRCRGEVTLKIGEEK